MLGFMLIPACKTKHFCHYNVNTAPAKPYHACPGAHINSFGQSASGGQAGACVAFPGRCTAVQPNLLADQALRKPDLLHAFLLGGSLMQINNGDKIMMYSLLPSKPASLQSGCRQGPL